MVYNKRHMKRTLFTLLTFVLTVVVGSQAVNAIGQLAPSGTAGDDTHYSLNDIYNQLVNFAVAPSATSSPFTTPGTPVASFRTPTEIYSLLTAENADLVSAKIATGTVVFGVTGTLVQGVVYPTQWSATTTTSYTWANAITYCDNLTESGFSDWRLPTFVELTNGVDTSSLSFDTYEPYWSSTTDLLYSDIALYSTLNPYGTSNAEDKTFSFKAICTR